MEAYHCLECGKKYFYHELRRKVGDQYWLEKCCSTKCATDNIKNLKKRKTKTFINPQTKRIHKVLV